MKISFDRAADELRGAENVLILTHRRPDGDTLGSAAALCLGLRQLGKRAYVLENPDITPRYVPMMEGLWAPEGFEAGYVCAVDVADRALFFDGVPGRVDLSVDHHETFREYAELDYREPGAASCGEIIFDILAALEVRLTADMASAVYTAAATDTGCFLYNNTTPRTHRVAAACMEAGADWDRINRQCFRTRTRARAALEGHVASATVFVREGRGAVASITRDLIESLGANDDDMENLASRMSETVGVEIAALLTQTKDRGGFKVSMRSGRWDVARICSEFGGGGHPGAAGCTLNDVGEAEAMELMTDAVAEALNE